MYVYEALPVTLKAETHTDLERGRGLKAGIKAEDEEKWQKISDRSRRKRRVIQAKRQRKGETK